MKKKIEKIQVDSKKLINSSKMKKGQVPWLLMKQFFFNLLITFRH